MIVSLVHIWVSINPWRCPEYFRYCTYMLCSIDCCREISGCRVSLNPNDLITRCYSLYYCLSPVSSFTIIIETGQRVLIICRVSRQTAHLFCKSSFKLCRSDRSAGFGWRNARRFCCIPCRSPRAAYVGGGDLGFTTSHPATPYEWHRMRLGLGAIQQRAEDVGCAKDFLGDF